ncbi:unnamed protein product [Bursaphelenchus okinawaensis]|uniref:Uncharacterized protein n=1 Tax=Bursaphelenchus okinawaensis TaxID=465554 RepID=A0A811L5W8_9BILA|nr:unnamed protein product [Bursaphelenchus okinawaensis]CAG9118329.1 unnamed protein product [Bursaphelenchus okinawaensis]
MPKDGKKVKAVAKEDDPTVFDESLTALSKRRREERRARALRSASCPALNLEGCNLANCQVAVAAGGVKIVLSCVPERKK